MAGASGSVRAKTMNTSATGALVTPFSAASEQRIFAEAASRNTASSKDAQLAMVSAAELAAARAAAASPASFARLCCTAWNFEIFFSNATRSLE